MKESDELFRDGISVRMDFSGEPFYGALSLKQGMYQVVLLADGGESVYTFGQDEVEITDFVDEDGNRLIRKKGK